MAAALRSSVGPALRRAAAAPASSRVSSAGRNAPANTCRVRTMHHDYSGGSERSMFDVKAYSRDHVPANPEQDKADGVFGAMAAFGTFVFACVIEGEYFGFCKETARTPRTSSRRRR